MSEDESARETLQVKISAPERIVWSGLAKAVSSKNTQGEFDVLPQHANFITLIHNADITIYDTEGEQHEFHFDRCAFYTHYNEVDIYVDV